MIASGQEGKDGLEYTWTPDDSEGVERDVNWTWTSEIAGPNQASAESAPKDSQEELAQAA